MLEREGRTADALLPTGQVDGFRQEEKSVRDFYLKCFFSTKCLGFEVLANRALNL
jgi:hypothetical protein